MQKRLTGFQSLRTDTIAVPPTEFNSKGTMSLAFSPGGIRSSQVVFRCVDANDCSTLWLGEIGFGFRLGVRLQIRQGIISPQRCPRTADCKVVAGNEDPTVLQDEVDCFGFEPALFWTEAYFKEGNTGPLGTNIVFSNVNRVLTLGVSQPPQLLLSPEMVMERWVGGCPYVIDMAKEPEFVKLPDGRTLMFFEAGASGHSRIALGEVDLSTGGPQIVNIRLALDVEPDTWYSNHVSTAGPPFNVGTVEDPQWVMLVNGQRLVEVGDKKYGVWQVGWANLDPDFNIVKVNDPFIFPVDDSKRGPHGQHIAFASGVIYEDGKLYVLWHYNDKVPHFSLYEGVFEAVVP